MGGNLEGREGGVLITKDIFRLLNRKKTGQGKEGIKKGEIDALMDGVNSWEAISSLADELILARRLAVAIKLARGKAPSMEAISQ